MRIGILGYGQLGRMLAMAGIPLGFGFSFYEEATNRIYRSLVPSEGPSMTGDDAFERFLDDVDIVSYETENTSVALVERVRAVRPVLPRQEALEVTQNRLREKTLCESLNIPTTTYRAVHSVLECIQAGEVLNYPFVLKTVTMGYDGKGQRVILTPADIEPAWHALQRDQLIAEAWVHFDHECSLIAVSDKVGRKSFYPIIRNSHQDGMLRYSIVGEEQPYTEEAQKIAETLLDHFQYVGVLTIEFFVTDRGLCVNELAPRVHNSGHWSIEGAVTSQFANHVRAITGLPIGDTALRAPYAAMVNLIGDLGNIEQVLKIPGAALHLYGKDPRPNRKLGHVTLLAQNNKALERQLTMVHNMLFSSFDA